MSVCPTGHIRVETGYMEKLLFYGQQKIRVLEGNDSPCQSRVRSVLRTAVFYSVQGVKKER